MWTNLFPSGRKMMAKFDRSLSNAETGHDPFAKTGTND
jgi:hypothetical protein